MTLPSILTRRLGPAVAGPGSMRVSPALEAGDTLVVWRLDRLGRADVQHLLELGAVRATSHPGEDAGWTRGCPGAGPSRRPQADQGRRSAGGGPLSARRRTAG